MKLVTEFSVFKLKGPSVQHSEMTAAGKTPEEIEQFMAEAQKLEGDKLKFFIHSLKAMEGKAEGLKRVLVVTFAEEEKVPPTAQKFDEHYYILDGFAAPKKAPADSKGKGKGRGGAGGKGRGGDRRDFGGKEGSPGGAKPTGVGPKPHPAGSGPAAQGAKKPQ